MNASWPPTPDQRLRPRNRLTRSRRRRRPASSQRPDPGSPVGRARGARCWRAYDRRSGRDDPDRADEPEPAPPQPALPQGCEERARPGCCGAWSCSPACRTRFQRLWVSTFTSPGRARSVTLPWRTCGDAPRHKPGGAIPGSCQPAISWRKENAAMHTRTGLIAIGATLALCVGGTAAYAAAAGGRWTPAGSSTAASPTPSSRALTPWFCRTRASPARRAPRQ